MAITQVKINNLPEVTTVDNTDILVVDDGTTTSKATKANLLKEVNTTLSAKQDATDNNLTTKAKTVIGGINEVNALVTALNAAGYKSKTIDAGMTTMGELAAFITQINLTGEHYMFDFHNYIPGAYVCVVNIQQYVNTNLCFIFDLLAMKNYGDYTGFEATELITDYLSKFKTDTYAAFKVDSSVITTMGDLYNYLNGPDNDLTKPSVNRIGSHLFFDLSEFITDAYACTIHMFSSNNIKYCFVFDMINAKFYGDYAGYNDSTTLATYFSTSADDLVKSVPLTDKTITLKQVKAILDEVNSLGHHVLFDTYALGEEGFYLTTISMDGNNLTIFDLVGAKLNTVNYKEDITLVEVMQGAEKVITEYNARILTDLIAGVSYRVAKLEGKSETADWATIQARVAQGLGPENYPTYDPETKTGSTQITVDWARQDSASGSETSYAMPFNVVAHTAKASVAPISVLDDEWSIDSYHTSNASGTDYGDENAHAANMMYMESQYTLPFGDQFDADEAMATVSANGLPAGTYYFKIAGDNWGSKNGIYYSFTTTDALTEGMQLKPNGSYSSAEAAVTQMRVFADGKATSATYTYTLTSNSTTQPTEGTNLGTLFGTDMDSTAKQYFKDDGSNHYLNHYHRIYLGYNRWSQSGLRQWLNSEGFDWWKSMNVWDRAPSYAAYRGFLSGLSDELKSVIKPVRRWQWLNTVTDGGVYEYTFDKVFLHTPNERYCAGNANANVSKEGSCISWPWYKSLLDQWNTSKGTSLTQFALWQTYDILKRYRIDAQISVQNYFSSSADRGNGFYVWFVNSSGNVINGIADYGYCCLPAFVITL